ncbi:hypothetical protein OKW48_002011 [Paraburkholderia youngii]
MDEGKAFEADAQSPEVMKPRNGALDHPACLAQSAAVGLAASGDFGSDAGCVQRTAVFVVIVAPIALNDAGLRKRPAALAGNGSDRINQRVKLDDIVTVGAGEDYRERDALRFGNEVML